MVRSLAALILLALSPAASAEPDPAAFRARVEADLAQVARSRAGLARVVAFARSRPDLFPARAPAPAELLTEKKREEVRQGWATLLDHNRALDALGSSYSKFQDLAGTDRQRAAFLVARAAFLAQYRHALEFVDLVDRSPALPRLLDEPLPDVGVPAGTWGRYRVRFLDVARGVEAAAQEVVAGFLDGADHREVRAAAAEDAEFLRKAGQGRGDALTAVNGLAILEKAGFTAWFPVPSAGTERRPSLLSAAEAAALAARLLPGDLLLERREGDLCHAGLPGFWTHAALYIGTPDERRLFFKGPAVEQWLRGQGQPDGDFERLLHFRSPQNQPASGRADGAGHTWRVLEAVGEGVRFGSLEHWATAGSLAVLRPRLPKFEKAAAVLRAFGYAGRPYDFDDDFRNDSALGCAELVFKSYEPAKDLKGLRLPLAELMGRPVLTPNDLARLYDAEVGSEGRQLDLVLFLDGQENQGRAAEAGEEEFRRSWRPWWGVPVKGDP